MKRQGLKITRIAVALTVAGSIFAGGIFAGRVTADQPRMQVALNNLNDAERALERATDDKGGHRVNALVYTRKAIDETKAGIEYDRNH